MDRATFDSRAYWDRRLERRWTLQGVGLLSASHSYNRWLYRVRSRVFHRLVRDLDLDPRGARVLDVGPGTGFYIQRWGALGAEVVGVDIADSAVERLRKRYPSATFVRLDIADDVRDLGGDFDIVDAFDVLFHIVDDEQHRRAIANIHGLLRPGGLFLFSDVFARRRKTPKRHYVRRTLADLEGAVRDAGFEIVRRQPAFVLMNYPFDGAPRRRALWSKIMRPLMDRELTGFLLGAALYPIEVALTRLKAESPTTEVMVCRKPSTPQTDDRGRHGREPA